MKPLAPSRHQWVAHRIGRRRCGRTRSATATRPPARDVLQWWRTLETGAPAGNRTWLNLMRGITGVQIWVGLDYILITFLIHFRVKARFLMGDGTYAWHDNSRDCPFQLRFLFDMMILILWSESGPHPCILKCSCIFFKVLFNPTLS